MDDVTFGRNGRDAMRWRLHGAATVMNDVTIPGRSLMLVTTIRYNVRLNDNDNYTQFEEDTAAINSLVALPIPTCDDSSAAQPLLLTGVIMSSPRLQVTY